MDLCQLCAQFPATTLVDPMPGGTPASYAFCAACVRTFDPATNLQLSVQTDGPSEAVYTLTHWPTMVSVAGLGENLRAVWADLRARLRLRGWLPHPVPDEEDTTRAASAEAPIAPQRSTALHQCSLCDQFPATELVSDPHSPLCYDYLVCGACARAFTNPRHIRMQVLTDGGQWIHVTMTHAPSGAQGTAARCDGKPVQLREAWAGLRAELTAKGLLPHWGGDAAPAAPAGASPGPVLSVHAHQAALRDILRRYCATDPLTGQDALVLAQEVETLHARLAACQDQLLAAERAGRA